MRTSTEYDLPLACIFRWERERADRVFLTQPFDGGKVRDWTWAQAVDEARRMAAWLKAQNWEPGTRVAILSKNCAWWIMADMAIWMAGYVSVPVYFSLRPHTVRQILEHSGAKACFLGVTEEEEMVSLGVPAGTVSICFPTAARENCLAWDDLVAATPPLAGNPERADDDLATIIYTSGTTGTPKGVMQTFGALSRDAQAPARVFGLTAEQRILSYLPLAHIVERIGVEALSIALGSRIFFAESLETFVTDLQRARPTLFLSVPRLMLKFQQAVHAKIPKPRLDALLRIPIVSRIVKKKILRQLGLDTATLAACGAAPLPPELLKWFRRLGLDLVEGYGMTETTVTHLPRPGTVRPGYVGNAVPGVEQKVGANGELLIRSSMNMVGYYKDPQGTRDSFTEDGFFRTGDVVEIAADGQIRIIGRIKEQFKTSKGKYVAPAPIEAKLMAHSSVEACCLMGAGMPSPFAVVLLSEDARKQCAGAMGVNAIEESLWAQMEEVNAQLDPHERVAFLAIVEGPWTIHNGLITPTMKIKRAVLEDRYQGFIDQWRSQERPVVWEAGVAKPRQQVLQG